MQAHIENIPAYRIVYMSRIGPYGAQNYKLMQDMKQWIQNHGLWNENGVIYAIAQDNAVLTPPEKCRYDVCFITDAAFDDNTVSHGALPAGKNLVYEIIHIADEVQRFYCELGNSLEMNGEQMDERRPILERYQFARVEKGYCEFCVPIL